MEHTWVKHTVTPVVVVTDSSGKPMLDSDGEPVILVDPDQQQLSEENTVYGCGACGQHISEAMHTECKGLIDE